MPITIGKKPESDFNDPIGLLADCHRRIEKFLDALVTVASEGRGNALDREQRVAVETSLQYFRQAAPKHTADEEESLFPRIRASQHDEAQAILSDLDQLHTDHATAEENHRAVDELFGRWLEDGQLPEAEWTRLMSLLHWLRDTYARHIKEEETHVFPNAARILTISDLKDVAAEMAQRRGLSIQPHSPR